MKRYLFLIVLIIYIGVLLTAAIITVPKTVSSLASDKTLHFIEFAILAVIVLTTLQAYKFKHVYALGFIFSIALMYLSEIIQIYTINRTFSWWDMLADIIGLIVGAGVYKWIFSKRLS